MARDSQRSKVYQWEHAVFAPQWVETSLTKQGALNLIRKVLLDAGRRPDLVKVRFTKRKGGACAGAYTMAFTPSRMPTIIVLHELAHTLTHGSQDLRRQTFRHGPRYVACYLALIERYMGLDISKALSTLRYGFDVVVKKTVPTGNKVVQPLYALRGDGTKRYIGDRYVAEVKVVETKKAVAPPKYDRLALEIWRAEFQGRKI